MRSIVKSPRIKTCLLKTAELDKVSCIYSLKVSIGELGWRYMQFPAVLHFYGSILISCFSFAAFLPIQFFPFFWVCLLTTTYNYLQLLTTTYNYLQYFFLLFFLLLLPYNTFPSCFPFDITWVFIHVLCFPLNIPSPLFSLLRMTQG